MFYTGFADEASGDPALQIKATKELGWSNIESRNIEFVKDEPKNIASLTDSEFDKFFDMLQEGGVTVNSYGSSIANWARSIKDDPEPSYQELRNAIPRLARLGTKIVRVMSFSIPAELGPAYEYEEEAVKRMKVLAKMAEDAGLMLLHENCGGWGGLSWKHTLRMLEKVNSPALRLVFDTGNPVFHTDYSKDAPYDTYQSSWEFYDNVRDFVDYIHIKDAKHVKDENGKDKLVYTYAGEGEGDVRKIVKDALKRGYDGGFSMEPHVATVFHEKGKDDGELMYTSYVRYGNGFMKLVDEVKAELAAGK